jgi:hypothetical protein
MIRGAFGRGLSAGNASAIAPPILHLYPSVD